MTCRPPSDAGRYGHCGGCRRRSGVGDRARAPPFLAAWAAGLRDPELRSRLDVIADRLHEAVAATIAAELDRTAPHVDHGPSRLAEMAIAMTHGFGIQHRLRPMHARLDVLAQMVHMFVAGVAAGPAGASEDRS